MVNGKYLVEGTPLWEQTEAFYIWLYNRKGELTAKHYRYWRSRMIREQGEQVNAEQILQFYDNHPLPIVRGMLNNLALNKKINITIPKIRRTKPNKLPVYYNEDQIEKIFSKMKPKYLLAVWIMYECGLRVSETINISLYDIKTTEGRLLVMGKGGKQRFCKPSPELIKAIIEHVPVKNNEKKWLFPSPKNKNQPIRTHTIRNHFRKIFADAKPHKLRHTFATRSLMMGINLPTIQKLLGHSNINTTAIYTQVFDSDIDKASEKLWRKND